MAPPRDRNQMTMNFTVDASALAALEGGSQEALSPFERKLRLALRDALDRIAAREKDPLDRIEIAARMSRLLGREITRTHIDNWTALSAIQRRMHADALSAICQVMDDWGPFHCFVEACGFKALSPKEAAFAEYGALEAMEREFAARKRELRAKIDNPDMIDAVIARAMGKDER